MIGWLRIAIGLLVVVPVTLALLISQMIAVGLRLNEAVAPRLWHKTILWALGIRVHRFGAMSSQRPLLLASNHVSWTDIMVLGSVAEKVVRAAPCPVLVVHPDDQQAESPAQ